MTALNRGPWADRTDAGRELGKALDDVLGATTAARPLVLGLPRGGVVVAVAVADIIDAELDVLVVRKAGVPWHRELALGAVTASGVRVYNSDVIARSRLSDRQVEKAFDDTQHEASERDQLFRAGRPPVSLAGRTVVIVDDGLATGATALAAAQLVQEARPAAARVLLAAPVAPPDTVDRLSAYVDGVVVLRRPRDFLAVGEWFEDFTQVDDEQVRQLMAGRHRAS